MKTVKIKAMVNVLFLGLCFISSAHAEDNPILSSRELETPLGTWRYETSGDGMKGLIFIHGEYSNNVVWKNQHLLKIQEYKNVYISLLGYGDSDKPGNGYSVVNWLDGIHKIAEQEGLQTLVLVAHGHGGFIAKAYQDKYPKEVKRLILINDIPSEEGTHALPDTTANPNLSKVVQSKLDSAEESGSSLEKGPLFQEIQKTVQWRKKHPLKIYCPVTMINGKSNVMSKKTKRKLKRFIPSLSLLECNDTGYYSQLENPTKINVLIAKHTLLVNPD